MSHSVSRQESIVASTHATGPQMGPYLDLASATLAEWGAVWARRRVADKEIDDDQATLGFLNHWLTPILDTIAPGLRMRDLDQQIARRVYDAIHHNVLEGHSMASTGGKAWGCFAQAMAAATTHRDPALKVLSTNPAYGLEWSPPKGKPRKRVGTFLFPRELVQLAGCTAVPLLCRQIYVAGVYLFARAGELAALDCKHFHWDGRNLFLTVSRQINRDGENTRTKTGYIRPFVVNDNGVPLLRQLIGGRTSGLLFHKFPSRRNLARELRLHLDKAGLTRPDLFADTEDRRPYNMQDSKATGLTYVAIEQADPQVRMVLGGHVSPFTAQGYIRDWSALLPAFNGKAFLQLPLEALGVSREYWASG